MERTLTEMQTHELKEQKLVAQLTARELAEAHHFAPDEDVQVKEEPEEESGMVNVQLHQDEQELVNGSIVFDENGQAYRYYKSESEYQAAQEFEAGGAATGAGYLQGHIGHQDAIINQDSATSFPLEFRLGNAAPPPPTMSFVMPPAPLGRDLTVGSGSWDPAAKNGLQAGDFARNLAFGNAGM